LEALVKGGAKTRVEATLNPQSFDPDYLAGKLPEQVRRKQFDILREFERMGFTPSLTCTPYYLQKPRQGAHLAWAESSAVVYANSVLGACTNREGGPSALAAAIVGKTADHGVHKAENRQPSVLVTLEKPLNNEMEYGSLGIYLGKMLGDKIPLLRGLRHPSENDLKQLGAALGAAGMTSMFCMGRCSASADIVERIEVEARALRQTVENLSTVTTQKPDLVFLGCPHCSLREIKRIAELAEGKKVSRGVECWVCTSRFIKKKARRCVEKIEKTGAHVLVDMCTIVSWTEKLGIRTIMTNSAKTAHYAPTLNKADAVLAPLEECLRTAFGG
jgi:predicted aconitase